MPDITAHAPDGTVHNFPNGTDPAVVDRVMKQYITGAAPASTSEQAERFQRQARGTNPVLNKWASEHPQEAEESRQGITRGPVEALGNLAQGAVGFGKQVLFPKGATESERLKNIWQGTVMQPLQAEQQKAEETTGPESTGHHVASYLPFVGPMAAQAGEALGRRDVGGGAVLGTAALAPSVMAAMRPHVDAATKLLDRQIALNKGRVGLVNDLRRSGTLLEDAVTGEHGEVGKHAQAVIAADKLDLARTQSEGKVPTAGATLAGQAVIDKTKMGGVAGTYPAAMPLDAAKALITQIGRDASRLERGGKAPEAAQQWAEYDALRKATQERADALGPEYGKSWKHYINEFSNLIQLKKGLFGHIMEDADHSGILKKLTSGDYAAQIPEIKDWMQKYGINSEPLTYAIKQGQLLEELSAQSKNMFMGKLRAIARHPIAAGGTAAAAAVAGHATGIPGMGFVLPLLLAGKVAGIIDAADTAKLLKQITGKIGPEMERVTPSPEGPQPLPQPPKGGAPPAPVGSSFKGGINPQGTESMTVGKQSTAASQTALVEQLQKAAAEGTPEEQAMAKQRLSEMGEQESAPKFAESRSELAGKLSKARGSRAQSGVYRGKR